MTLSMDACQGDSGGPLLRVEKATKKMYLLGITSLGIRCGDHGSPGGYVYVRSHASWLCTLIGIMCVPEPGLDLSSGARSSQNLTANPAESFWSFETRSNISIAQFNASRRCHPVEVGSASMRMDTLGDVSVAPRITNGVSNIHLLGMNMNASHMKFVATLEDWQGNGFCGAVSIAPNLLLTVAHCMGAHLATVSFRNGVVTPLTIDVLQWAVHPRYSSTLANDIGIVRTRQQIPARFLPDLNVEEFIASTTKALATSNQARPALVIAGRGAEEHGGHFSNLFSMGIVNLITAEECMHTQVGEYISRYIEWDSMLCALDLTYITEYSAQAAHCAYRDSCLFSMDGQCDSNGGASGDCLPNTDCSDCWMLMGTGWASMPVRQSNSTEPQPEQVQSSPMPPLPACASKRLHVTAVNGEYRINGTADTWGVNSAGVYFLNIDAGHPLLIYRGDTDDVSCIRWNLPTNTAPVSIAPSNEGSSGEAGAVVVGDDGHTYRTGAWTVEFSPDCANDEFSLQCAYHGSMNGASRFVWRNDCDAQQKNPPPPLPYPPPLSAQGGDDFLLILGLVVGGIALISVVVLFCVLGTLKKNSTKLYTRPGRDPTIRTGMCAPEMYTGAVIRFTL